MVTILDVAKKAGVSKATVSRALNGKVVVSENVKARINQAIAETGYRPNLLARHLATSESNSIGLVITNGLYDGLFFPSMIYQAASISEAHQRQLVLADGKHCREDELNAIHLLLQLRCEAIMIYPKYLTVDELDEIIDKSSVPIMVINRKLNRNTANSVFIDNKLCSFEIVNYLLEKGHRRIAFIGGTSNSPTSKERLMGYHAALESAGITADTSLMVNGNFSAQSGYNAAIELLKRGADFTCILAANDDMAMGAMKALTERGYKIPDDISVAGFDNADMGRYFTPALTTVHIPMNHMIKDAVLALLSPTCLSDNLPLYRGELIVRDSVAENRS